MIQTHHLPYGTLTLDISHSEVAPDDLFGIGARQNPKRAFLFVSKVLGKHYPADVCSLPPIYRALAAKLPPPGVRPVVFVGMAETATALAQGVFEAWLERYPQAAALYLHTSRLRAKGAEVCPFEESHSHASRQFLHLPGYERARALLQDAERLILIDDELSTGNTFRQLASALQRQTGRVFDTHWVCLTDFCADNPDEGVVRHSLLRGSWSFAPAGIPAAAPAAQAAAAVEVEDSGSGRLGICGAWMPPEGLLREYAARHCAADRILVLGTGEYIHPPAVFARELAARSGARVFLQSSTRSPAENWGALQNKRPFADPYGEGVPYYLYNLPPSHSYNRIYICHEHCANAALKETAAELEAELVCLGQAA
ncbi:MAG: phosphoribosyltransferase domain-containing protein [Neisseria sp.]|nr:phosphoribosyltransferase domain-containing protein [Neisseria sp.]